eukprot:15385618-Alexandrium_andersonii.AAC.1
MSASLVGSEMCIRDRAPSGQPWLHRPRAQRRGVRGRSAGRSLVLSLEGCLLYTSDAADDM